ANELDSAASMAACLGWLGTTSRSHCGSGSVKLAVGGAQEWWIDSTEATASRAPAAPSACPCMDFVDEIISFSACDPKTERTAAVSAQSLAAVPVPCALIYPTDLGEIFPSASAARMAAAAPSGDGCVIWYAS